MTHSSVGQPDRGTSQPNREADVRVLIVDDQEFFRSVLHDLVAATPGFAVVGEAASGEEALSATDELGAEFVVMDVRMPGMGGIQAARTLVERHPHSVVLLVSAQALPEIVLTGPAGQAVSFMHKEDLRCSVLREVWERRAQPA
jgi:two-component system invasion response regulator UvrY